MRSFLIFISLLIFCFKLSAQTENSQNGIKWHTLKEALELNKKNPKRIFVDVYTDWCGWCKVLDKSTFTDPNIIQYMNDNYYAAKFNAEGHDTIEYLGKKYYNREPGPKGSHELAVYLLHGQLSYPNLIFMDENSNIITPLAGYRKADELMAFLVYFAKDVYKTTNLDDFEKNFKKTFFDTSATNDSVKVKWYDLNEAVKLSKTKPKKIFLEFYADWCLECRVMYQTTYTNPVIAKYLNDNFYPVHFNVTSKDTVEAFGGKFFNEGKTHPYHQLPVSILQGKMNFPAMIFVNEDMTLITNIESYRNAASLEPILEFIAGNAFKTQKWEEFIKTFKPKVK